MKYKALLALLLLSSLVLIGPACRPRASYAADDKSKIHVGIVFDIGGKDDRSFMPPLGPGEVRGNREVAERQGVLREAGPGHHPARCRARQSNFD